MGKRSKASQELTDAEKSLLRKRKQEAKAVAKSIKKQRKAALKDYRAVQRSLSKNTLREENESTHEWTLRKMFLQATIVHTKSSKTEIDRLIVLSKSFVDQNLHGKQIPSSIVQDMGPSNKLDKILRSYWKWRKEETDFKQAYSSALLAPPSDKADTIKEELCEEVTASSVNDNDAALGNTQFVYLYAHRGLPQHVERASIQDEDQQDAVESDAVESYQCQAETNTVEQNTNIGGSEHCCLKKPKGPLQRIPVAKPMLTKQQYIWLSEMETDPTLRKVRLLASETLQFHGKPKIAALKMKSAAAMEHIKVKITTTKSEEMARQLGVPFVILIYIDEMLLSIGPGRTEADARLNAFNAALQALYMPFLRIVDGKIKGKEIQGSPNPFSSEVQTVSQGLSCIAMLFSEDKKTDFDNEEEEGIQASQNAVNMEPQGLINNGSSSKSNGYLLLSEDIKPELENIQMSPLQINANTYMSVNYTGCSTTLSSSNTDLACVNQETERKRQLRETYDDSQNASAQPPNKKAKKTVEADMSGFILAEYEGSKSRHETILRECAGLSQTFLDMAYNLISPDYFSCVMKLGKIFIGEASGISKAQARKAAAETSYNFLKPRCWNLLTKKAQPSNIITRESLLKDSHHQLPTSKAIAPNLSKAETNKFKKEANREYKKVFSTQVGFMLDQFMASDTFDLQFSPDFKKKEKKCILEQLSQRNMLKISIQNLDIGSCIFVRRKWTTQQIRKYFSAYGGESETHVLKPPVVCQSDSNMSELFDLNPF